MTTEIPNTVQIGGSLSEVKLADMCKTQQVEKIEETKAAQSKDKTSAAQATTIEPSMQDLDVAVTDINSAMQNVRRELKFTVEEDLGKTVITVLDRDSQEVVRQIPPKEVIEMAQYLKEMDETQAKDALSGFILEGNA